MSVSNPDPDPELPPPERPDPGTPQPGKPPGTPQPGDPPPAEPKPDKPAPVRPKSVAALLIALLIFLSTSSVAFTQPPAESIDDDDILEAVEVDLRSDGAISEDNVDVTVNAGVVTLSGQAFTLLAKRRAVRLIGSLKGVRSIVDQVEVVPNGNSDKQVFADVQAALEDDPVADVDKIQVTVGQGRVKLVGAVDSFAEKSLLEATVAGVRGVVEIDNQLSILAPTIRSDKEIKPEILRRFELSPYLAEGLIDVEVNRGKVTLGGAVGSLNEKVMASVLCWVPGVRQVDDTNVEIKWWLVRERRRDKFTVLRNDVQLQRAVQDALLYDPRIQGAEITVRVRRRAVSLSGDVSSLAAKRAAEHDAENTLGVRRVINHLKVKSPDWPGDLSVTKRAQEALARDSHLTDFDLKSSSHFGKVYLRGDVNTHFEKERAEVVIANLPGVLEVVNRIHVDADEVSKPDEEIEEDVKRRLRWSPLLDAEQISVAADNGTATLRGTVDTWHQRKAAERHAYQAGAQRVANEIAVRLERGAPLGLKATLVPQNVNYELDPKHLGESFRRFLTLPNSVRDPRNLPPAPSVDLTFVLHNERDKPIDVRLGHDKCEIEMSLTGEGAVRVRLAKAFSADFHPGRVITIDPGMDFDIPISSLQYGFRNASERWYWTEPGDYMLQVTYTWPVDVTGIDVRAVAAAPVQLNVKLVDETGGTP